MRGGEWYVGKIGLHDAFETWEAAGKPSLLKEINEKLDHILSTHWPLPLPEEVERELACIQDRARDSD